MEEQVYKIVVKERARLEVLKEYTYLFENYSERVAEKFLANFIVKTEEILPFVWSNPECRFLPTKNRIYRNIVWGNYLIIYKIQKKEIWIVGFFHTKQNPSKLRGYKKVK